MKNQAIKNLFLAIFCILSVGLLANTTRSVDPFDQVIVSGKISAQLVEGTEESIEIKNNEDKVSVEVVRGILKVKMRDKGRWNKIPTIRVVITYKKLRAITGHAGSNIEARNDINGDKLSFNFDSGAKGEFEVNANSLEVDVQAGGSLRLEGKTESMDANATSGGRFEAGRLDCNTIYARANTGGSMEVVANKRIEASANTGGSIRYKGDPAVVDVRSGWSGGINKY